jgi:hypothetical protein
MAVRHVGMMAGLLVVPGLVVIGSRTVVLGGVVMVFCSFSVMLSGWF